MNTIVVTSDGMSEEMGLSQLKVQNASRSVVLHAEEHQTSIRLADQHTSSWGDTQLIGGFAATVNACPWREVQQELGALIERTGAGLSTAAGRIRDADDVSLQAARKLQENR